MEVRDATRAVYRVELEAARADDDVPPGYKRTEAGVIPEDWGVKSLGEVVDFLDGLRRPVKDSDRAKMRGNIPYYGASGIVDYVDTFLFNEDLILLGEDGENILSRNCRLAFRVVGKCWINNHAHVLRPRAGASYGFLVEFLESINYAQYNTGTAQPKLNKFVCARIPVARPSFAEQQAIAEALSDADALIESLEQLIAKQRALKQGAMQALLTGRQRLSGFTGEWQATTIGDVFQMRIASSKSEYIKEGGSYYIVDMGSVSRDGKLIVSKPTGHSDNLLAEGDLVMPKDDIGGGNIIGRVAYIDASNKYVLGDHVYALRTVRGNSHFFAYLINRYETNSALRSKVGGSAQLGLAQRAVREQEIPFPSLEEQTAIATILSDMDAEIEALEARLAKSRALKAGMMQQLLTGRIRLV